MNVIAIYDNNFNILFENAQYIKASVSDDSQMFSHPLEDGSKITDHKVDNPIEINLQVMLLGVTYISIYQALNKIKLDATALTIQTKTNVYSNMYISSLPYEEDNTVSDGIKIVVSLIQATFENPNTIKTKVNPRYAKDGNTINKGNIQGEGVSDNKRQSVLKSLL